jgi:hypothetical protein
MADSAASKVQILLPVAFATDNGIWFYESVESTGFETRIAKRSFSRIRHALRRNHTPHGKSILKNSSWKTKRRVAVKSKLFGADLF